MRGLSYLQGLINDLKRGDEFTTDDLINQLEQIAEMLEEDYGDGDF